jgi:hypothetical protein
MTDQPPCTASITNDHSDGTQHCTLPAGHSGGEHGNHHVGPPHPKIGSLCWADDAIGAVPHQQHTGHGSPSETSPDGSSANTTPAADQPETHVCKPGATVYFCPAAGETESDCHGGFDICCGHPELHQPLLQCSHAHLRQAHGAHSWEPQPGMALVHCEGHGPASPALHDQYAAAIYEYNNPGHRWADAHPDDLICYGAEADAALAVRDRELEQLRTELAMEKAISADLRVESRALSEKVERVRAVVRAELDYLCREPHPSHDHVCPDDVRRSVLRALESEGQA